MKLFFKAANPNAIRAADDDDDDDEMPPLEEVNLEEEEEEEEGEEVPRSSRRVQFDEEEEEEGEEEEDEDEGEYNESSSLPMSEEEIMLEKQSVILELERLKAQGIKLSKEYTLDDNLADMQFEVRRHLLYIDETNNISLMKDGLKLLFGGIEGGNRAVGNILQLDGWSAHACTELDRHKYDQSLSALYRKYWRRGSSSPEMELAFGVLSSIGTWHVKQQFSKSMAPKRNGLSGLGIPARLEEEEDSSDDEDLPPSFVPRKKQ